MSAQVPLLTVRINLVYLLNTRDRVLADIVKALARLADPKISIRAFAHAHEDLKQLRQRFIVTDDAIGVAVATLDAGSAPPAGSTPG